MHIEPGSLCEICSASRQLEVHHLVPKRMGGSSRPEIEADANKVILCRSCHAKITEQRWRIERDETELSVRDVASETRVMRRLYDRDFSASTYFDQLNLLEPQLGLLLQGIPYLSDAQLVDLFAFLRSLGQSTWQIQAAVLWEAKHRSVYGDRAWEAMGQSFGIGWRQAYNLARVWETFFLGEENQFCNQLQNWPLQEVTWYIVASETEEPRFWLSYAEDRKAEQPNYSIADFRDEIDLAGAKREAPPEPAAPASEGNRCHWLRVYCARLDRVVRPDACPGCDTLLLNEEVTV